MRDLKRHLSQWLLGTMRNVSFRKNIKKQGEFAGTAISPLHFILSMHIIFTST